MAPCRDRNPTPIRFEERRIQGLFGLKTTLFLVLKQSRAGARFWGRAGRFQTLKQRRLFYAGNSFHLGCINSFHQVPFIEHEIKNNLLKFIKTGNTIIHVQTKY